MFPGESPAPKRYYVEDDEGHHHGPLDDYEEAAGVADAIHGRIIARRPSSCLSPPRMKIRREVHDVQSAQMVRGRAADPLRGLS